MRKKVVTIGIRGKSIRPFLVLFLLVFSTLLQAQEKGETTDSLTQKPKHRVIWVADIESRKPLKAGDPHRFFEASWMHKYNGKYYFSYSTGDSHLLCYAIGDNPYGPFTYQGVILEPVVGWTTHHCIVEYKGKWYLFHHDCVPSNDITHLRSLKVMPLEYDEEGKIKTMVSE